MKKVTVSLLLLFAILLTASFTGCKSVEQKLAGTWTAANTGALGTDNTYCFNEDGTGTHTTLNITYNITYTVNDSTITILTTVLGVTTSNQTFTFELKGDTLKLTDGATVTTFTRVNAG